MEQPQKPRMIRIKGASTSSSEEHKLEEYTYEQLFPKPTKTYGRPVKYHTLEEKREADREKSRRWREKNPEKANAYHVLKVKLQQREEEIRQLEEKVRDLTQELNVAKERIRNLQN